MKISYRYVVGDGCPGVPSGGPTFAVFLGGAQIGSTQGPFRDFPYEDCMGRGGPYRYSADPSSRRLDARNCDKTLRILDFT